MERLEDRNLLIAVFAVTNTNDAGPGSLRQAILDADAASDAAEIRFQIMPEAPNIFEDVDAGLPGGDAAPDVFVIRPQSPLPAIEPNQGTAGHSVVIDGGTQNSWANGGDTNPFGPEIVCRR